MPDSQWKTCSRCGACKMLTDFGRKAASADGYRSECKSCKSAAAGLYRSRNLAKCRADSTRWKLNNGKRHKNDCRRWRQANKDKIAAYDRANAAATARRALKRYLADKDGFALRKRLYRKRNPEAFRAQDARRRARKRNAPGRFSLPTSAPSMRYSVGVA
jgi:hypothetical protein